MHNQQQGTSSCVCCAASSPTSLGAHRDRFCPHLLQSSHFAPKKLCGYECGHPFASPPTASCGRLMPSPPVAGCGPLCFASRGWLILPLCFASRGWLMMPALPHSRSLAFQSGAPRMRPCVTASTISCAVRDRGRSPSLATKNSNGSCVVPSIF